MSRHSNLNRCSEHFCKHTRQISTCRYCNTYFCNQHIHSKKPSEVGEALGHVCDSYVDFLADQSKREIDGRSSKFSIKESYSSNHSVTWNGVKSRNKTNNSGLIILIVAVIGILALMFSNYLPLSSFTNLNASKSPFSTVLGHNSTGVTEILLPNSPCSGSACDQSSQTVQPITVPENNANDLAQLRQYALDLINIDRTKYNLANVTLGSNSAAQSHAEELLSIRTLSHWNQKGEKPYMRYTKAGGLGNIAENAAYKEVFSSGFSLTSIDPREAIQTSEYNMMYDDASSNWGHRDNIVRKEHNKVNLGIAYDHNAFVLVQDFEDDYIAWAEPINFDRSSGILRMSGVSRLGKIASVALFYDPTPTPMTKDQLDATRGYGLGDEVGYLIERGYTMQTAYVNAETFEANADGRFSVVANISSLLSRGAGVYTIVIWDEAK